jgi:hypothetical protein
LKAPPAEDQFEYPPSSSCSLFPRCCPSTFIRLGKTSFGSFLLKCSPTVF